MTVHCPNPGSMRGLRIDEMPDVLVSKAAPGSSRKLDHTLEAIFLDERTVVGCNTSLPNYVVSDWLTSAPEARTIFGDYTSFRREVVYGIDSGSRIDFVLEYASDSMPPLYVEVKNVTMSWNDGDVRVAVFPDSKTVRGQKHLRELVDVAQRKGTRACVLYFINRQDCEAFAPCSIDSKYVQLFYEAEHAGVCAIPLVFALKYDGTAHAAEFNYIGRLPLHPRSGP
jgi:sugar fermentation stimulation protein A